MRITRVFLPFSTAASLLNRLRSNQQDKWLFTTESMSPFPAAPYACIEPSSPNIRSPATTPRPARSSTLAFWERPKNSLVEMRVSAVATRKPSINYLLRMRRGPRRQSVQDRGLNEKTEGGSQVNAADVRFAVAKDSCLKDRASNHSIGP
jgi:hypothetical protein